MSMPAAFMAAILSAAFPLPPEMMAPAWPMRRGLAGDESHYRFFDVFLDEFRGRLFRVSADFADHHDRVRVGVLMKQPDRVDERGADDRIAADPDAGRLPDAEPAELPHG